MPTTSTHIYGNWRYYRSGQYVYCWTTQRQHHYSNKYVSFVRRWHKTKSKYVTVESKTATHASRAKAKERAMRLAGMNVPQKEAPKKTPIADDEAYCMRCKGPRKIEDAEQIKRHTHTGKTRYALSGTCSSCGTNVTKFISKRRECPSCLEMKKDSEFGTDYMCYDCRH